MALDPVAVARAYADGLVPALLQEWVPHMVSAAALRPGHRVLDVGCGTGILTQAVAEVVAPAGSVVGLDIGPGMLAVARSARRDLQWVEANAEHLPFREAGFDRVVSQFSLMSFDDAPATLAEMWRVLRPGGRMAVSVWAALEDTPAYQAESRLIERLAGPVASAPLRLPFRLGDPSILAAQFERARVPIDSVSTLVGHGRFPSIRTMVEADLLGWLPVMGVHLPPATIDAILREAEDVLGPYRQADGTARFESPAHIAVATRPA